MIFRIYKISVILISFIFLTGFVPFSAILGPGLTIGTTGNLYKAATQFIIDHTIKQKTGKDSLTLLKEEVDKQNQQRILNEELKQLIEKRVKIVHKKLQEQNKQKIDTELRQLVQKRIEVVRKEFSFKNINQ